MDFDLIQIESVDSSRKNKKTAWLIFLELFFAKLGDCVNSKNS